MSLIMAALVVAICLIPYADRISDGLVAFLDKYVRASAFIGAIAGLAGGAAWNARRASWIKYRFVFYYVILLCGDIAAHALRLSIGMPRSYLLALTIPGVLICILGVFILARFLRNHPVDEDPMNTLTRTVS